MTDADRELVELAAKAYGLQVKGWVGSTLKYFDPVTGFGDWDQKWNPLESDGDALRLAVKIGLKIKGIDILIVEDALECDRLTATRRAITLAAAEIGRELG